MVAVREYLDAAGRSPFQSWFETLDAVAAAKVTTALARLEQGNFSSVKGVGAGVLKAASILGRATASTSGNMGRPL